MTCIGIDLGTTNSLIGVWENGSSRLIENALGEVLTPSVVSIDETGEILVGKAARERLTTHPDRTIAEFKRWMGTTRHTTIGDKTFRPEELSALVLRSLKRDAERYLGQAISEAVISVPAYFNNHQRQATVDAGRLAGLSVKRLINEPTAAALAYGLEQNDDMQFLVFDLGGGTFDVSIMEMFDGVMEVHASAGDNRLGGKDFRNALTEWLMSEHALRKEHLSKSDLHRIDMLAETVKNDLSSKHESSYSTPIGDETISGRLSRDSFEQIVSPLIARLRAPLERAIRDTEMRVSEIDRIILVGGATRMPCIRATVGRLFGKLPMSSIDPDCIVAHGAVKQAALLAKDSAVADVVLTDVCPFTLGVGAYSTDIGLKDEPVMNPIIERNAVIPISRSNWFTTVQNNQTTVELTIYQGESLRLQNNILLGTLAFSVPKAKSGEEPIEVRFTYDVNGILEVVGKVMSTGLTEKIVINTAGSTLTDAEIETRLSALSALKMPLWEQTENRVLIARAERLFEELSGDTRREILEAIGQFRNQLADQQNRRLEHDREAFAKYLDLLEKSILPE